MSDARSVTRAQLAVAALGATAVLLVIAIGYDALRFHGLTAEPHMAFALLDALVIARASVSLVRGLRGQRAFLRHLPVLRETVVHGHGVRVVPGRSGVFCAGLLRPAVYIAEGTLRAGRSASDAKGGSGRSASETTRAHRSRSGSRRARWCSS